MKKYFLFIGIALVVTVIAFYLYFLKLDKELANTIGVFLLVIMLFSFLIFAFLGNGEEELKEILTAEEKETLTAETKETLTAEEKERAALIMALEEAESKLKKYTFLKLDEQIVSSIHQYLVFFSNYVKESKKISIIVHASEVEGGLDIAFDFPETTTKEELQIWLDEYLGFLTTEKDNFQVNTVAEVTNEKADVLILKLKNQVQHFKHSLDILRVENNLLKSQNEQISDITKLLASKSDQIFISTGNNSSFIKEQSNITDKAQFIGNSFHKSEINISEIDDRIVDLIKTLSKNSKQEKNLLEQLEIVKSETSSEKEKKKSGSMIRKFLETCNAEVAKQVIKTIAENGEGWVQYISTIF